jgi:hypothetical protein
VTATVGDPGTVIICGDHFDGRVDPLGGPTELLVKEGRIAQLSPGLSRPAPVPVLSVGHHPGLSRGSQELARFTSRRPDRVLSRRSRHHRDGRPTG